MTTQEKVEAVITALPYLPEILEREPEMRAILEEMARAEPVARWRTYSVLKARGMALVGWEAREPQLRGAVYYDTLTSALGMLLPGEEEEAE